MKLFLLALSTIIFTISLHCDECYSIRILSLKSGSSANTAKQTLQNRYEKNKLFASIQKQYKLNFTTKKIGDHYVLELNCFANNIILQKVIDIIRVDYNDAFVRKEKRIECAQHLNIQTNKKVKTIYKEVIKEIEVIKEVEIIKEITVVKHNRLFFILFIISSIILLILAYLLYSSKKELSKVNKLLKEKDTLNDFNLEDFDFDDSEFDDIDFDITQELVTDAH